MKKFMLLAASALLLAGMMVSCEPKEKEEGITTLSSFVKKDIQTFPDQVIGASEKEATKILTKAGFEEKDDLRFKRQAVEGYLEYIELTSIDGVIYGMEIEWSNLHADRKVFLEALLEGMVTAYDKELLPNMSAKIRTDELTSQYAEGKYIPYFQAEGTEVEGDFTAFFSNLKLVSFENYLYVNGRFSDEAAGAYFVEESLEDNGLVRSVIAQMEGVDGYITFKCAKDKLSEMY